MPAAKIRSTVIKTAMKSMDRNVELETDPKQICIICTDESLVSGFLISDYANEVSETPVTVTDDRRIPGWLDENGLTIIISKKSKKGAFSDTLKTISKTGCKIVTVTDFDYSFTHSVLTKIVYDEIEGLYEYIGYTAGILISLMDRLNVLSKAETKKTMENLSVPDSLLGDFSKELKSNFDKTMIINYLPNLRSAARLMKISMPKYLGRLVLSTEYPEFNHNEIVGWCMSQEKSQNFVNIFLCDENAPKLLSVITESLLETLEENKVIIKPLEIDGKTNLEKNLIAFVCCENATGGE